MRIRPSIAEKLDVGRECRATIDLLCVAGMLRNMKDVECEWVDCSASSNNYKIYALKSRNFYRRPTYLSGELMKVSSMSELGRKVKMGASLSGKTD
jgi:hypothetical protein